MHCPFCRHPDSRVIDSRTSDDGLSIRRRRQCPECGGRWAELGPDHGHEMIDPRWAVLKDRFGEPRFRS